MTRFFVDTFNGWYAVIRTDGPHNTYTEGDTIILDGIMYFTYAMDACDKLNEIRTVASVLNSEAA